MKSLLILFGILGLFAVHCHGKCVGEKMLHQRKQFLIIHCFLSCVDGMHVVVG